MIDGHTDILNGIFVSAGRRASLTRDEYVFTYFLVRDKNVRSSIAPPDAKQTLANSSLCCSLVESCGKKKKGFETPKKGEELL